MFQRGLTVWREFTLVFLFLGFSAGSIFSQQAPWTEAQSAITAWHNKQPAVDGDLPKPVLRVVYFHGNDMEPLKGFRGRLTRVMDDISEFYSDGMKLHGMVSNGLALEKDAEGQLILHVVKGQHKAAHYNYESGTETEGEIRKALAGKFDIDREFVLVLYGQCWKMKDGRYGFFSPYYGKGGSNQRWGFCHAADCHLLDTNLLTDTKNRFKYWEHYGDRNQTLAKFNSFYIGGIAHELGHGLGLPHTGETPLSRFRQKRGNQLMGMGNLTYREELWNPRSKGSFLSEGSAVRLVSHPIFTGSHVGRFEDAGGFFSNLKAEAEGAVIKLSGKIESKIPSYAAVLYVDPSGRGDYDSRTYSVSTTGTNGEFSFQSIQIPDGEVQLRLFACFMNGETERLNVKVNRAADGSIETEKLFEQPAVVILKVAEQAVSSGKTNAMALVKRAEAQLAKSKNVDKKQRVALLKKWLQPQAELVDLATFEDSSCYLSDAKWEKAESGWAGTPRDRWGADSDYGQGLFLDIAGKLHEKGLPAHCPAEHVFATTSKWDRFQATVGLRDGAHRSARAIFIVSGDGKELFRSEQLALGQTKKVDIDISGVKSLSLVTQSGQKSNHTCWAVWGSVEVLKK